MTATVDVAQGAPAPLSLASRFGGVLLSPRATYADVTARPRWGGLLMVAIIAGVAIAIFNAIMGGDATYKQAFAIVVHSGVVMTVSQFFFLPLAYARQSMSGATNLGVFVPFLDEDTFVARLLGSVDLFVIWWLISLAIGLGVLYRRRTGPIANGLLGTYVAIGLIVAGVKTA